MNAPRLPRDTRRQQILDSALPLFARSGFAQTTTRSIADAAGISEALLFKHFPTKSAVYAAILADVCAADPGLIRLRALPPSTETLVFFVRGMVSRFLHGLPTPSWNQKLRLTLSSYLEDGEYAQILFDKLDQLVTPVFVASLQSAVEVGDAKPSEASSRDLFWFAHHCVLMVTASHLPLVSPLLLSPTPLLEREICQFILRGIGLTDAAIAAHVDREMPPELLDICPLESQ